MKPWSRKTYLLIAIGVIVLSNAVALGGVAWNRSGEPESQLKLSLRELSMSYSDFGSENSGLNLHLDWRTPVAKDDDVSLASHGWRAPVWLDQEKMLTLGFELPDDDRQDGYPRATTRDMFIVLENAGPAWQKHLQRVHKEFDRRIAQAEANPDDKQRKTALDSAREWLQLESNDASRLFFVDAGLDADALRQRHADHTRYAIMHGRIVSQFDRVNKKLVLSGRLQEIPADSINVPYAYRKEIAATARGESLRDAARKSFKDAEFSVAFGRRLEPWLVGMTKKSAAPEQSVDPSHQD